MYRYIFALALLMAWGCQHNPDKSGETNLHDHAHADEASQYTLFSDHTEFFIKHEALESGHEAEVLVYVTLLDSYKPCTSGILSIRIDDVSVTSDSPDHPGIFHIPFTPEKAGAFDMYVYLQKDQTLESVHAHVHVEEHAHSEGQHSGTGNDHTEENHPASGHAHDEEDHPASGHAHDEEDHPVSGHAHAPSPLGEITFLKEQAWENDFRVDEIRRGDFHAVIPTSGEIVPLPGDKKNIPATTRGMVQFVNPQLVQGSYVEKGQLLFTINPESLVEDNVNLKYEAAKNKLEKSRSEFNRHRSLYERKVISERQYQESRAIYVEDSLRCYNLKAHVSDEGIRIVAPASGSLHDLGVSDGMYVSEGTVLAVLSPDRNLMLRADLPQQYFRHSEDITTANFRPAYSENTRTLEELSGELLAVGHSVKENDHYLPVNFLLRNDGSLLEGAFAEVYLIGRKREQVLTIPLTALGEEQGGKYAYVQVSGESYSKRRVTIGDTDGRRVEITGGLRQGERVVTRGTMLIKAASMKTGEIAHGHSH